jgi:hypothetical protein
LVLGSTCPPTPPDPFNGPRFEVGAEEFASRPLGASHVGAAAAQGGAPDDFLVLRTEAESRMPDDFFASVNGEQRYGDDLWRNEDGEMRSAHLSERTRA